MKFCDKLQKIRKENNITQEQFADKLNVSRQAVSKWESGTAYPDTEKLIQISKIFNVSLDELINDSKDMNKKDIDKKFNFTETFNIIFEFISKIFSMFSAMKFGEKIKFLIELVLVVLALWGVSAIANSIICEIVRRLFIFMPDKILHGIIYLVDSLLYVGWIILGIIVLIRVIKTRYLDYYVIIKDNEVSKQVIEEPIKELKEKKPYKLVIRDPEHSSFNIFKKIWKLFILIFKFMAVCVAIPIVFCFITFVVLLVISLMYIFSGLFFNGISLAILGTILFTLLIIYFLYNLVFNRKNNYSKMFVIFIISITFIGIGIGLSFVSFSTFDIYDGTVEKTINTYTIEMKDNLIVDDIVELPDDKIVIDNTLSDIKLDIISCSDGKLETYTYNNYYNNLEEDNYDAYEIIYSYVDYNEINRLKKVMDDLKKKRINTNNFYDNCGYEIDKVYISNDNLTKIRENYAKLDD